MTDSVAGL